MINVKFQFNKSPSNALNKNINDLFDLEVALKDETDIVNPILILGGDITNILQANYAQIPIFNRSYFIGDMISQQNGIYHLNLHVDVLYSFRVSILKNSGIVKRNANLWNKYLDDGFYKTYQNPHITSKEFPNGFTNWNFYLTVAGD